MSEQNHRPDADRGNEAPDVHHGDGGRVDPVRRAEYLAQAKTALLLASAGRPVTVAEAVRGLTPPPGMDLRALGKMALAAERAGEIQRTERQASVRPGSHGAPVMRWVRVLPCLP